MDSQPAFNWHPGLMLPKAKMQPPFYADLVTGADPTSRFSFMNYLKTTGKLFRFAINESFFPYRSEFNAYCQWVANQLPNLQFGSSVELVQYDLVRQLYRIFVTHEATNHTTSLFARNLVLGIGSEPHLPDCVRDLHHPNIFHAAEYLRHKHAASELQT